MMRVSLNSALEILIELHSHIPLALSVVQCCERIIKNEHKSFEGLTGLTEIQD